MTTSSRALLVALSLFLAPAAVAASGYCCVAKGGQEASCVSGYTERQCMEQSGMFSQNEGVCRIACAPKGVLPSAAFKDPVLRNVTKYHNPFPDTNMAKRVGAAAAELYRRKVIAGYDDGKFHGSDAVTRAQTAKLLLVTRFSAVKEMKASAKFSDVSAGQWYVKYVAAASEKGIIKGYPDGTFKPDAPVNTAEFLKMLAVTFGLKTDLPQRYTDVPKDSWFARYAGIAQKYELFPDRGNLLEPGQTLTRADVTVAIYQYLANR